MTKLSPILFTTAALLLLPAGAAFAQGNDTPAATPAPAASPTPAAPAPSPSPAPAASPSPAPSPSASAPPPSDTPAKKSADTSDKKSADTSEKKPMMKRKPRSVHRMTRQQEIDHSIDTGTVPSRYRRNVPREYQQYIPFER